MTNAASDKELLIATIGPQAMGIGIDIIVDVLHCPPVTPVPRGGSKCMGLANLRGQIITLIDVRECLGMKKTEDAARMAIVVEHGREYYGLLFDNIGSIVNATADNTEALPATLAVRWDKLATGILRLPEEIIIILDAGQIIESARPEAL